MLRLGGCSVSGLGTQMPLAMVTFLRQRAHGAPASRQTAAEHSLNALLEDLTEAKAASPHNKISSPPARIIELSFGRIYCRITRHTWPFAKIHSASCLRRLSYSPLAFLQPTKVHDIHTHVLWLVQLLGVKPYPWHPPSNKACFSNTSGHYERNACRTCQLFR